MDKNRIRDIGIGFLLCLSLVVSYHCGSSNSIGPNSANASAMASNLQVVGGAVDNHIKYLVVDVNTGKIVASEKVEEHAIGTDGGHEIGSSERYW